MNKKSIMITLSVVILGMIIILLVNVFNTDDSEEIPSNNVNISIEDDNSIVINPRDDGAPVSEGAASTIPEEEKLDPHLQNQMDEREAKSRVEDFLTVYYTFNKNVSNNYYSNIGALTTEEVLNKIKNGKPGLFLGSLKENNISDLANQEYFAKLEKINNISVVHNNLGQIALEGTVVLSMPTLETDTASSNKMYLEESFFIHLDNSYTIDVYSISESNPVPAP